jgi:hypothetical protein
MARQAIEARDPHVTAAAGLKLKEIRDRAARAKEIKQDAEEKIGWLLAETKKAGLRNVRGRVAKGRRVGENKELLKLADFGLKKSSPKSGGKRQGRPASHMRPRRPKMARRHRAPPTTASVCICADARDVNEYSGRSMALSQAVDRAPANVGVLKKKYAAAQLAVDNFLRLKTAPI